MQPRKYVKWTPKIRRWIINQWKAGIIPLAEVARNRGVPRRTVYNLIKRFNQGGYGALEPKPRGRKRETLNPAFE